MISLVLRGLVAFEWRQQHRQWAFRASLLLLPLFALVMVSTGYGPGNTAINAPYVVVQSFGLLSLLAIFAITIFTATGALRDAEHGMTEIVRATAVGRTTLLAGRFAGILLAGLVTMFVSTLTLMAAPYLVGSDPSRIAAIRPEAYLYAYFVVAVPNVLLIAAFLFAVATVTRRALPTYVGGVVAYAMYFVAALLIDSPLMAGTAPQSAQAVARAALLDPFGISAFYAETRFWTPEERNHRMLPLWGPLLFNRALWLGVTGAILAFAARYVPSDRRRAVARRADTASVPRTATYEPVAVDHRSAFPWQLFRSTLRLEIRSLLGTWSFAVLALLWVMHSGIEVVSDIGRDEFGTRLQAATMLILPRIAEPLAIIVAVALIYFIAEIVWRERASRVSDLVDATAGRRSAIVAGKYAAAVTIVLLLTVVGIAVGVTYQLVHGYSRLEPGAYGLLFLQPGLAMLQFAALALLLQALSPNRYVGMVLCVVAMVVTQQGSVGLLAHPLFRYSAAPAFTWSDLSGVSAAWPSFLAFSGYWSFAAILVLALAAGAWPRGRDLGVRRRLRAFGPALGVGGRRLAAVSGLAFVASGGFLASRTLTGGAYESAAENEAWRVDYERTYSALRSAPTATLRALTATVHLSPAARTWTAKGSYTLVNEGTRSIDTLWIAVRRDVDAKALSVAGASPVADDRRFGMRAFRLASPLRPGDSVAFTFDLASARRTLRAMDFDESVAPNGTFLVSVEIFPTIGYRNGYELLDPRARKSNGLPATPPPAGAMEGDAGGYSARTMLDVTIETDTDQVAQTSGQLIESHPERGIYRYRTTTPIRPFFAITSGRFAQRRSTDSPTPTTVYYSPKHEANAGPVLAAATSSLALFGAEYGAYGLPELRVVEVPGNVNFAAFALPGVIYLNERRGMLTDLRDTTRVDLVLRRIAHEVSHQWWGHRLETTNGPGASLLVESLAKYSEQLAIGRRYGPLAVAQMVAFDEERYLEGRGSERDGEPPLAQVRTRQAYLYYGKGSVVLHATEGLLGEAALHGALRQLLAAHSAEDATATSEDFVALLRGAVASDSAALARLDDDYEKIVTWDAAVDSAWSRKLADGTFEVTARMKATKCVNREGKDLKAAANEPFTILFRRGPTFMPLTKQDILRTESRELGDQRRELTFTLKERPDAMVIDPYGVRIDRDRSNNVRQVN